MSTELAIDGECTVYRVHELREQLMTALSAGQPVVLDLADVAEFDGAALQLLLSARREAAARGTALHIRALSPMVSALLAQIGLTEVLPVSVPPEPQGVA